jgi:type I restriction enzyme M protein
MTNFRDKGNFIWSVADLLRGDYKQSEYGKVILPFTVLRRLDSLLEKKKTKVLKEYPKFKKQLESVIDLTSIKSQGIAFTSTPRTCQ